MSDNLGFYLLFSALMAIVLAGIFIMQFTHQQEFRVDQEAQDLADTLSRMCFDALKGQSENLTLSSTLGGASYWVGVDEEKSGFTVHMTGGHRAGYSYLSYAGVSLQLYEIEDGKLLPGDNLYFKENQPGVIVLSTSPIPSAGWSWSKADNTPPGFYYFARENQRAAAAIIAGYWEALQAVENSEGLDVAGYSTEEENWFVLLRHHGEHIVYKITEKENSDNVGKVDNAWTMENTIKIEENFPSFEPTPENVSIENALKNGWLYLPYHLRQDLCGRTWEHVDSGEIVTIPPDFEYRAAVVTTEVSTYPAWRIEFSDRDNLYTMYYYMMPWWWAENIPGFVFQSEPELTPVI
jgi:hypothetical protein